MTMIIEMTIPAIIINGTANPPDKISEIFTFIFLPFYSAFPQGEGFEYFASEKLPLRQNACFFESAGVNPRPTVSKVFIRRAGARSEPPKLTYSLRGTPRTPAVLTVEAFACESILGLVASG